MEQDNTNPNNETPPAPEQGESNQEQQHSPALQQRFNELTGQNRALAEANKTQADQIAELMKIAMKVQTAPIQEQIAPLPEGVDPNLAKFFKDLVSSEVTKVATQTQQLVQQIQQRQDQTDIDRRYDYVPPEVRAEAGRLYAHMKKKYGDANMDDAMDIALGQATKKAMQSGDGGRNQFNQLPQGMRVQGVPPNGNPRTNDLTPPSQDPNWDRYSNAEQNKRIDDYLKKGGKLIG